MQKEYYIMTLRSLSQECDIPGIWHQFIGFTILPEKKINPYDNHSGQKKVLKNPISVCVLNKQKTSHLVCW